MQSACFSVSDRRGSSYITWALVIPGAMSRTKRLQPSRIESISPGVMKFRSTRNPSRSNRLLYSAIMTSRDVTGAIYHVWFAAMSPHFTTRRFGNIVIASGGEAGHPLDPARRPSDLQFAGNAFPAETEDDPVV